VSGSHHIHTRLPGGELVCVSRPHVDERLVKAMRRVNKAMIVDHREPRASDVAAIMAWWQENAIMSSNCIAGVCPPEHALT
jgi:hypothetical protein